MKTNKYSFWSLINEFNIEIPIIQRDYAQGRKTEKVSEIRVNFVDDLHNSLINSTQLDLDFVYGSVRDQKLIPLDGQQRLTTLFLLHWYLANKEGLNGSVSETLTKFTYETRTSSREFCNALISKGIDFSKIGYDNINSQYSSISSCIQDSYWFFLSWKNDPTIKSMLVMLDEIHQKFQNSEICFESLTSNENTLITFQFIKIENFGLTDNLYIKMNARGKQLTDFENFKAKFEQFLEVNHSSRKNEFATKIDGVWTDLFWQHKVDFLIDKPFMRYFYFVTEMLYYMEIIKDTEGYFQETVPKINFELISNIYRKEENLIFLFNSIDFITYITDIETYFISIFSEYEYKPNRVTLFEENVNLFKCCVEDTKFGIMEKILFFSILKYSILTDKSNVDGDLRDFLRVIRNLLLRVRWLDKTKYESNLRYEFIPKQIDDICNVLISNQNVYDVISSSISLLGFNRDEFEFIKAKKINDDISVKPLIHELEDNLLIKGLIHNFDIENNALHFSDYNIFINEIWPINTDSDIIRALLSIGDISKYIGTSALGYRYFFGNKNKWNTILTNTGEDQDKIKSVLPAFFSAYSNAKGSNSKKKLECIFNSYFNNDVKMDWRYYFIKYPEMISTNNNLYTWKDDEFDFEIRNLGGNSLLAYHINPYVRTVAKLIDDEDICILSQCYSQYAIESPLVLVNGVCLYCEEEGWRITLPEDFKIPKKIFSVFSINIIDNSDDYRLIESDGQDRIEVAVDFVKKISK
jgi:hypothetical protein